MIKLPWTLERDAPPFEGNDIRYPESLVRYFLKAYTKKGEKVFDPFYTTKAVGDGLGLGLSLSYGLIQSFGGQLLARNHPVGGAVFEIRLPKAEEKATAAE